MNNWQPIETAPKDGTLINIRSVYFGVTDDAKPCFEGLAQWRTGQNYGVSITDWMRYGTDKRVPGRVMEWCRAIRQPQALQPQRATDFVWVIPAQGAPSAPGRAWKPAQRIKGNRYLLPGVETAFEESEMFAIGKTFAWTPPVEPSSEAEPHETPRDVLKRVTLSLQAAITMLEQGDKSVAASDVIFDLLMDQFRNSLYAAKELLK